MTIQDDSGTHVTLVGTEEDSSDHQQLPRGSNLGRYVIIEPIGSGGMGTVYRAYDPQLNRGVALKILSVKQADLQAAERAKARLIREAQALAQLSHPNVVAVHDAGTFEDDVFIAMELVEGETLGDWLKEEKREVKEILDVMIAAGRGLSAAHKAGLVHRDFKPGNVIVGDDGRVRVLDFGLARAADQQESNEEGPKDSESDEQSQEAKKQDNWKEISSDSSPNLLQSPLTHAGGVLGTPMYMAPEQHLGSKTDERTDQFGFCVVLYEALYGKRPFAARSMGKLKSEVIRQQVLVPRADSNVPAWLWKIIYKGLSVKPEDRYATIESLLEELQKDPEEVRRQKRLVRTRKIFVISLILLTVALPIGVWYGLRYRTFQLCKDAEGQFDGVWDEATKVSIRKAFLSTEKSFAQGTWERVAKIFDSYQTEWVQMRSDICEARLIRGTQSEELFDLRMSCLLERIRELGALSRVLTRVDAGVVQKAVEASSSLTNIAVCADIDALTAPLQPPRDASIQKIVDDAREELNRAMALSRTGQYQSGLETAQSGLQLANRSGYPPVKAEALMCLANLQEDLGNYALAVANYQKSLWLAVKENHDEVAAQTANHLLRVVGYRQGRHKMFEQLATRSASFISRIGNPEELLSNWHGNMGMVLFNQSDWTGALEHFRKALQIQRLLYGPNNIIVSNSLSRLGAVMRNMGRLEAALEFHQRALATRQKILGNKHPHVAACHNNIGNVYRNMGKLELAMTHYRQSLAIWEPALGIDHPTVSASLHNMATVFSDLGQNRKAAEFFLRAVRIREKTLGSHHQEYIMSLVGLAGALSATGDYKQASKYVQQTLKVISERFGPAHQELTWPLQIQAANLVRQRKHNTAIIALKRALQICSKSFCPPDHVADLRFDLAKIMWDSGKGRKIATALAKEAMLTFKELENREPKGKEIQRWLQAKKALNDNPR